MNEETESDTVLASRPRGDLPARVSPGAVVLDALRDGGALLRLFLAFVLWFFTACVPYVNLGTTVGLASAAVDVAKGRPVSPIEIFDARHRARIVPFFLTLGFTIALMAGVSLFGWLCTVQCAALFAAAPGEIAALAPWLRRLAMLLVFVPAPLVVGASVSLALPVYLDTGALLDEMAAREPRLHVLHHGAKAGLGRAYVAGFKWGLERGYERLFEMDADGSHDPKEIPAFLAASETADLVLGTRYKGGIRVIDWPLNRLLLSMGAGVFVRLVTGLPVSDPTGGYKCYSAEVLRAIDLDKIVSNGYSFQMETTFSAWTQGFRIAEVPIVFLDRRLGYSKLSLGIAREAFAMVFRLAWRNRFRRRPRAVRPAPAPAPQA